MPESEASEAIEKNAAQKAQERLDANIAGTASAEEALATIGEVGDSELSPFAPRTFADAWKLAHHIANSGIVPDELKGSAGAVLSVMARGAVLGVHWSVAIQTFHVVKGKVGLPADLMAGICNTDPEFEYFEFVEGDDESATVEAKKHRWDKPRQYHVTIEEARKAGYLDGKHSALWKTRPRTMLRHMATREAARQWNQARLSGLYDRDELTGPAGAKDVTPAVAVKVSRLLAEPPTGPVDVQPEPVDADSFREAVKVELAGLRAKGEITHAEIELLLEQEFSAAALADVKPRDLPRLIETLKGYPKG